MSTAVVHRLEGVVRRVDTDIPYLAVYCAEATDHRRVIYLEPWAVRSAKVGDRVIVEYRTTASRGFWVVAEVLS